MAVLMRQGGCISLQAQQLRGLAVELRREIITNMVSADSDGCAMRQQQIREHQHEVCLVQTSRHMEGLEAGTLHALQEC